MGISYTICYCTYNRKCKSRLGENKDDTFDKAHWDEIKDNFSRYLSEDVCVPGADKSVQVPSVAVDLLSATIANLAAIRKSSSSDASGCLDALSRANEAVARLSYLCHQINAAPHGEQLKLTPSLRALTRSEPELSVNGLEDDQFLQVAAIIVKVLHRAIYELVESKKMKDPAYIFHHLAIVFDAQQELYRLVVEAMGHIGSERFLPQDHQHYEGLERRWEQDGI